LIDARPPGSNPPTPDKTRLVFGFAPSVEGDRTRQALVEVCRFLSDTIGIDVAPMRVSSYAALERAMVEGRASFGWFPPVVLARLELTGRALPIAQCIRGGAVSYHACVLASNASGIETLSDIKRARAVWVDRSSAAGFVFPRLLFAAHGIDAQVVFAKETFVGSHAEVVRALVEGTADIGATFATMRVGSGATTRDIVRGGWTDPDGSNAKPVRILETFGPIPNDAMAVSTTLDPDVRESIVRACEAMTATPALRSAIRHLFGADALGPVGRATYDALRDLVGRALRSGIVVQ
jgi:phosphonate transport system substrate-binding protein